MSRPCELYAFRPHCRPLSLRVGHGPGSQLHVARLNALQTHGAIKNTTTLVGLKGSTLVDRYAQTVSIVTVAVGLSDSTRGGGTFTMGTCQ